MGYSGPGTRLRRLRWALACAALAAGSGYWTYHTALHGGDSRIAVGGIVLTAVLLCIACESVKGYIASLVSARRRGGRRRGTVQKLSLAELVEDSLEPEEELAPLADRTGKCPFCRSDLTEGLNFCLACRRRLPEKGEIP